MYHRDIGVEITPDINAIGLNVGKTFVTGFQPLYVGNRLRIKLELLHKSAERLGRNLKAARVSSELRQQRLVQN
jgi:hypothetical protein